MIQQTSPAFIRNRIMVNKVNIGFVGCGMIGQVAHIANFIKIPNCHVVAAAELRPELGRLAVEKFNIPKLYSSHIEMLKNCDLDAVVIVTRRNATGPIVVDCLRAGKHVLSEKPMAHSVEQARQLVAESKKNACLYSIGFMKRHDEGVKSAKLTFERLMETGELGKILSVRCYCYGGEFQTAPENYIMSSEHRPDGLELWNIAPDWLPTNLANDFAWFVNVFIHDVNLIRFLTSTMPKVQCVNLKKNNGRMVIFDTDAYPIILEMAEQKYTEWTEGVEIQFEYGRLKLRLNSPLVEKPAKVEIIRKKDKENIEIEQNWAFSNQAKAFIADIIEEKEPITSGEDSLNDMVLVEDIWRKHLQSKN